MTAPAGPVPSFVVAGAGRAGSTAVAEALRAHPDVFVTQPKEPHFLALGGRPAAFTGPGDDTTINRLAVTDRDRYLDLFRTAGDYLARGEGSVSTLYYPATSIPAIQSVNPRMRIVIMLRDPVERAFSSFQYLTVRGFEPLEDFLEAVDDESRRRELGWHHLWHYTAMSHYADAVAQFREAFGDQVEVWFHDDLVTDPAGTVDEILRFVGVDPSRSPSGEIQRVNASGRPRVPAVQSAMQWGVRHAHLRATVKRVVPFRLRERIRSANLQPNTTSAAVRSQLQPMFTPDLERLQGLLGRSVPTSWWE